MKPTLPLPILGWTALVFVASFLNWARIPLGRVLGQIPGQDRLLNFSVRGLPLSGNPVHELTAWTAKVHFFGIELPPWLVFVAALLVAVVSLLKAFGAMTPESARRTACAAAVAGFLHVAAFIWLMMIMGAPIGLGAFATATGMFALSVLAIGREGFGAAREAVFPHVENAPPAS
jgi:hypothetical protein